MGRVLSLGRSALGEAATIAAARAKENAPREPPSTRPAASDCAYLLPKMVRTVFLSHRIEAKANGAPRLYSRAVTQPEPKNRGFIEDSLGQVWGDWPAQRPRVCGTAQSLHRFRISTCPCQRGPDSGHGTDPQGPRDRTTSIMGSFLACARQTALREPKAIFEWCYVPNLLADLGSSQTADQPADSAGPPPYHLTGQEPTLAEGLPELLDGNRTKRDSMGIPPRWLSRRASIGRPCRCPTPWP
jgi:hypothetical protein